MQSGKIKKLISVWIETQKVRSGTKAFFLALLFSLVSFWVSILGFIVASLFLFSSVSGFLLTGIASIYSIFVVQNTFGGYWGFAYGFDTLLLLFLIKDYAVANREFALSVLSFFVVTVCFGGFFAGEVPIYLLLLMVFACAYDLFSMFQVKDKALISSSFVVLSTFEIVWSVSILFSGMVVSDIAQVVAKTILSLLFVVPIVLAIIAHHKGELFEKNRLFAVISMPIIALIVSVIILFY